MTDRLYPSLLIAQRLKENNPDIQIIFGGAHINATGTDVMENLELGKFVDACLMKESEETLPEYLNGGSPSGLICRDANGQVQQNEAVIPKFDLDDLPFPNLRDITNIPAYYTPYFSKGPMTTMMATRGCPYSCTFCDVPTNMGKKYRHRSAENLVEEILFHRKNSGVRNISFKDSIFNLRKNDTIELCELLLKKNIDINWVCNSRVDTFDPEMVKMMARAGCKVINFGVESMDTNVLNIMKKKNTLKGVRDSIQLCRDLGIATTAYYMVGNDGETYESYLNGLNKLMEENPTLASFSIATAYPGTQQYFEMISKGYLKDPKWYNDFDRTDKSGGYLELPNFSIEQQVSAAKISSRLFFYRFTKITDLLRHFFSIQFLILGFKFILRKNNQFEY